MNLCTSCGRSFGAFPGEGCRAKEMHVPVICKADEHVHVTDDFGRKVCEKCGVHSVVPPGVTIRTECVNGHDVTSTLSKETYDTVLLGTTPLCPTCWVAATAWVARSPR